MESEISTANSLRERLGESSPGRPSFVKLPRDHLDDPVAAHLSREVTAVQQDHTVGEVLAQMRAHPLASKIVYIYVLDTERRLVGVLPTRHLLSSSPPTLIRAIMIRRVVSVPHTATVYDACRVFMESRLLALPVIDDDRKLVGVVDIGLFTDEIVQVSERYSFEDVFQLIGVQMSCLDTPSPWAQFRARFPWLVCNIIGGMACAALAGFYERLLDEVIVLALFIPVVLALAESVGMQSMTLTLQRLHGVQVKARDVARAVGRELLIAGALGLACGGAVGCLVYLWKGDGTVAAAICASIALAMVTSCLLAVILPTSVHAMKMDPRIAAGPIVLAAADVATLLFYFNLALWFLSE